MPFGLMQICQTCKFQSWVEVRLAVNLLEKLHTDKLKDSLQK